jgi:ubiquinone/menaquinone biosynthesis C-methylase UbiE
MSNKFQKRHNHFGSGNFGGYFSNLLDAENTLKEIGLKTGNTLLDAGCGDGRFSILASEIVGDNGKIYAFDTSEEAINNLEVEVKKKDIRNIEAFVGDMTKKLPLDNETIDVYLMANVLHGLVINKEVKSTLEEAYRTLRPNGTLAAVDFKKIDGPPGPPISIRMTPEEVEKIISKYGFKKKKVIDVGKYHYTVTFTKK